MVNVTGVYAGPAELYSPSANQWTLKVLTPDVEVRRDGNEIKFVKAGTADVAAEANVEIRTGDGTTHEISNVDKITW